MNQQQIKLAITGISKLLGSNPELLAQQLAGLKTLLPSLNEAAITSFLERTKTPGFQPHKLEEEFGSIVSAIKGARR
jgi:hypothetical protein